MNAFLIATALVALAEMGDKTQLLAFILAARYRKPLPIIAGIFTATVINHAFAGAVGLWITQLVGADVMRWVLGLSFIAMAAWILVPDTLDEDEAPKEHRFGVFGATTLAFFWRKWATRRRLPPWRWARVTPPIWCGWWPAPRWA